MNIVLRALWVFPGPDSSAQSATVQSLPTESGIAPALWRETAVLLNRNRALLADMA